ncbi:MAG: phosphoribosylamine--glycine ligase, partial [Spirochaetes bacterium]|nr:phosphoribosylamine--glycine ligase [Spirochaetota bacterium]
KTDLIDIMKAVIKGTLNKLKIKWSDKKVMTVVAVSKGYPDKYAKGYQIQGIRAITDPDSVVFHAGTKIHNNMLLSSGGRVLNITAIADNFKKAREKAYSIIQKIHFKDMAYRKDIGKKLR